MKFEYPKDYKTFMIGLIASLSAVALWDVIKSQYKIFNYKVKNDE
jgi:hypothetical protein